MHRAIVFVPGALAVWVTLVSAAEDASLPTPHEITCGVPVWEELAPPARAWAATAHDTRRNRLFVIGGTTSDWGEHTESVWTLDLAGGGWERIRPAGRGPGPRRAACAVYDSLRDRVVLFGGEVPEWYGTRPFDWYPRLVRDLWVLSLSGTPSWTEAHPPDPQPTGRARATLTVDPARDEAWLVGGDLAQTVGVDPDTTDPWRLRLADLAWERTRIVGPVPERRAGHGAVFVPWLDRLIVHGGSPPDAQRTPLADTWALTPGANPAWSDWTGDSPTAPAAASDLALVLRPQTRDVLRVARSDPSGWWFARWDPATRAWESGAAPLAGPEPRAGAHAATLGGAEVAYGGGAIGTAVHADVWRLHVGLSASASALSPAPGPDPREAPVLALDAPRARLVQLKGGNRLSFYDLASGTWSTEAYVSNAPRVQQGGVLLDEAHERLLFVGGCLAGFGLPRCNREVLALSLSPPYAWTTAAPEGPASPAVYSPVMLRDPPRDRWLLLGSPDRGLDAPRALRGGAAPGWVAIESRGTPAGDAVTGAALVPGSDQALVVGFALDDTLRAWRVRLGDTLVWTPVTASGPGPGARAFPAVTVDPAQARALVHGGLNPYPTDEAPALAWELSLLGPATWRASRAAGDPVPDREAIFASTPGAPFVRYELVGHRLFRVRWELPAPGFARAESAWALAGAARLVWSGSPVAGVLAYVERASFGDGGVPSWARLGPTRSDESGRWRFEDAAAPPGPLAYRLVFERETGPVVAGEVRVGAADATRLRLASVRPNPGASPEQVEIALPRAATVTLELFDVTGRRMWRTETPPLVAGTHVLPLRASERPRPGLYWLHATAGAERASARVAIVR